LKRVTFSIFIYILFFCFLLFGDKYKNFNSEFQIIEKIKLSQKKELIFRVSDFKVDNDRNFWIVDNKSCKIKKYNQKGELLLSFGRNGQGPGEFVRIGGLEFDRDKRVVYVLDSHLGRFNIFDEKGTYLNSFSISPMRFFKLLSDGNIIACEISVSKSKNELFLLKKYNSKFKPLKSFYSAHRLVMVHQYTFAYAFFDIDLNDNIYVIQPEDYTIYKYDSDGKLVNKFSKRGRYYILPPTDFKINKMNKPKMDKWLSSFSKITNLAILKNKKLILVEFLNDIKEEEYYLDIYDFKGNFIKGGIQSNFPILTVDKGGYIYFLSEKETENFNIEYEILKCFLKIH
jgi:hypothetical protein